MGVVFVVTSTLTDEVGAAALARPGLVKLHDHSACERGATSPSRNRAVSRPTAFLCGFSSAGLPKFFADDPPNRCCINRLSRSAEVLAKRFIDHRLVAPTGGVRALSEHFEQVVVQEDGDACLAWLPDHRSAHRFAEVVFLPHTAFSLGESPSARR